MFVFTPSRITMIGEERGMMHDTHKARTGRFLASNLVAVLLFGIARASAANAPPPGGLMSMQTMGPGQLAPLVGQHLQGPDGSDAGRLWEVLVDPTSQPRAAVIEYGGFAGMGRRKVAVGWSALRFHPGDPDHRITLLLSPTEVGRIPDFKGDAGPITFGSPSRDGDAGSSGH
jgi:PRC-barrel domain